MEDGQFRFFSSLPPELRLEIYLLATPPRVVEVQEFIDQLFESFQDEILALPDRLKIDPSLAYFAFNWRRHILSDGSLRQRPLDAFGFTSNKSRYQPWPPSLATPEIPLGYLDGNLKLAWEMTRYSHLYSNAPIPPLLHTCRESRAMLMNYGYQLAFRTRSSEPRTWFNYERDVLSVKRLDWNHGESQWILSGCEWDLGQFQPEEMQMVRNLALDRSCFMNSLTPVNPDTDALDQLSSVLRLFPKLRELVLMEWINETIEAWPLIPCSKPPKEEHLSKQASKTKLWIRAPVEEIDCALHMFSEREYWRSQLYSAGYYGSSFVPYKRNNGSTAMFFKDLPLCMEKCLAEDMNRLIETTNTGPITPWNIPTVTVEHVLSPHAYQILCRERILLAEQVRKLQREWASIRRPALTTQGQPSQGQDAESEFGKLHWPDPSDTCDHEWCQGHCYEASLLSQAKEWWIQEWRGT